MIAAPKALATCSLRWLVEERLCPWIEASQRHVPALSMLFSGGAVDALVGALYAYPMDVEHCKRKPVSEYGTPVSARSHDRLNLIDLRSQGRRQ
jgi:hypothetical protein